MTIWSILRPLEIFYGHLVYFVVIWCICPCFGILDQEKSGNPALLGSALASLQIYRPIHLQNQLGRSNCVRYQRRRMEVQFVGHSRVRAEGLNKGDCLKLRVRIPPEVDVMITIFSDFRPFSTNKLAFFSKTNVMIIFFKI
jgi:hypothetical protein